MTKEMLDKLKDFVFVEKSDNTMTKQEVIDMFTEYGDNLFGIYAKKIGEALANEIIEEVEEAGDDNLQKAIAYVILDKFGKLV